MNISNNKNISNCRLSNIKLIDDNIYKLKAFSKMKNYRQILDEANKCFKIIDETIKHKNEINNDFNFLNKFNTNNYAYNLNYSEDLIFKPQYKENLHSNTNNINNNNTNISNNNEKYYFQDKINIKNYKYMFDKKIYNKKDFDNKILNIGNCINKNYKKEDAIILTKLMISIKDNLPNKYKSLIKSKQTISNKNNNLMTNSSCNNLSTMEAIKTENNNDINNNCLDSNNNCVDIKRNCFKDIFKSKNNVNIINNNNNNNKIADNQNTINKRNINNKEELFSNKSIKHIINTDINYLLSDNKIEKFDSIYSKHNKAVSNKKCNIENNIDYPNVESLKKLNTFSKSNNKTLKENTVINNLVKSNSNLNNNILHKSNNNNKLKYQVVTNSLPCIKPKKLNTTKNNFNRKFTVLKKSLNNLDSKTIKNINNAYDIKKLDIINKLVNQNKILNKYNINKHTLDLNNIIDNSPYIIDKLLKLNSNNNYPNDTFLYISNYSNIIHKLQLCENVSNLIHSEYCKLFNNKNINNYKYRKSLFKLN